VRTEDCECGLRQAPFRAALNRSECREVGSGWLETPVGTSRPSIWRQGRFVNGEP
jgi:hypothetical protein